MLFKWNTIGQTMSTDAVEESRSVHKINAPWLANGKKMKKNRPDIVSSAREDRVAAARRNPVKKQMGSVMCNGQTSVEANVERLSYPASSALRPPRRAIPAINNYEALTLNAGQKSGSSSFAPSDETQSSNDSGNERVSRTAASSSFPPQQYSKQMDHPKSIMNNHKLESRMVGNPSPGVDFPQETPRRRNTSPARLRRQEEPQNRRYEYKRYEPVIKDNRVSVAQETRVPADKETRMALEMQKDMERMSMKCAAVGGDLRRSSHPFLDKTQNKNAGFSILPSAMSCLNPMTQLDAMKGGGREVHTPDAQWVTPSAGRSGTNDESICKGVSSAFHCDVKDDDELWKYYDDGKFIENTNHLKIESRVSSLSQNSTYEERQESYYRMDREPRRSSSRDKYDQAGQHSVVQKNMISNATSNFGNRTYPTRHIMIGLDQPFESDNHYENLKKYSRAKSKYGQEESQPTKEELLNQMRQAVEKASVQLKLSRTSETEYTSDESTYVSNRSKHSSSRQDLERRAADGFVKYQIQSNSMGDKYAFI